MISIKSKSSVSSIQLFICSFIFSFSLSSSTAIKFLCSFVISDHRRFNRSLSLLLVHSLASNFVSNNVAFFFFFLLCIFYVRVWMRTRFIFIRQMTYISFVSSFASTSLQLTAECQMWRLWRIVYVSSTTINWICVWAKILIKIDLMCARQLTQTVDMDLCVVVEHRMSATRERRFKRKSKNENDLFQKCILYRIRFKLCATHSMFNWTLYEQLMVLQQEKKSSEQTNERKFHFESIVFIIV